MLLSIILYKYIIFVSKILKHDTYIIKYLLNPREKGGRGLKHLSKTLIQREMIELSDLMPDAPTKDYSLLDPSWRPCVLYAAADAICTLGIFEVLHGEYDSASEHTGALYVLERACLLSTRWMHRNRVFIDKKTALKYSQDGQKLWFNSLIDVYKGANDILGRDVTPNYVKILTGELKGENKFDHLEVEGMCYKERVDEARREAMRTRPDSKEKITKSVKKVGSKDYEEVAFPLVYDVLSPRQLGLLFREIEVPGLVASEKSGQVVTAKDVLEDVIKKASDDFPFMAKIKTFRELGKSLGQYLVPFVEDVGKDGTLKPKFDQFSADTGRFSCKTNRDPKKTRDGGCRVPFQGIPATYDPNKPQCIAKMRDCISVRDDENWLVAIDYAGVELRLVTNLSLEPKWIKAFFQCSECGTEYPQTLEEDGIPKASPANCTNCGSDKIGDLHTITAVAFYGEEAKKREDWKSLRGNGKGCNFALSYGGTGKAVQRTLGCSQEEGEEKYKLFTKTYKSLTKWWSRQHNYGRKHGYVKTGLGRVQPLPDIKSDNFRFKSKDERKAVNGPVQGTSADVTKLAMSLIYKETKKKGWHDRLKMILTVHDEIVFEIHDSILDEAIELISHLMTRNNIIAGLGWAVPLTVDVEIGKSWTVPYDLKDIRNGEAGDKVLKSKNKCNSCDEKFDRSLTVCPKCSSTNFTPEYSDSKIDKTKKEVNQLYKTFNIDLNDLKSKKEELKVEKVNVSVPSKPTFTLDTLTKENASKLADWIKGLEGDTFDVMYQNRSVKALLD